jgi:transposase
MNEQDGGLTDNYRLPDALWEQIVPVLPPPKPKKKAGRPPMDKRQAMTAIFYLLRTGCQWNALPRSLGAYSTVHGHFQEWRAAGVFAALRQAGLLEYDRREGFEEEKDGTRARARSAKGRERSAPARTAD